jgi:WD40 repeat protein
VHGVAFSPDGAYFVSVGADRKIFLFDGKEGTLKAEITDPEGHKGSILSVSWNADSKRFVTASTDQSVKLWDAESQALVKTWTFGTAPGSIQNHQVGVVWTPRADGLIISLSLSGDLNYLLPDADAPIRIVQGHQKPLTALEVASEGTTLFTGSTDGRVCKWELSSGLASIVQGEGHTNVVTDFLEVAPNTLSSVGWDDKLRLLDSSAGAFTSVSLPTEAQPKGLSRLSETTLVLLTTTELRIYSTTSTPPSLATAYKLTFAPTALATSFSHDDIAVAGSDNKIRIFTYSPSSGIGVKHTITLSRSHATSMAFSPSGEYLAAGEAGGMLPLFSVAEGYEKVTDRWAFHTARIEDVAWNVDGTHVATASLDTNVFVYSVKTPTKNAKFRNAHMGGVNRVRWVEGGNGLVSVGNDGAVKKWEVVLP